MEFLPSLLLLIIITVLFLFGWMRTSRYNKPGCSQTKEAAKLPPGPSRLPVIGSLHHLLGSSLPHHTLANLAKTYGPLMHLKLGEVSTIIVSSPEVAQEFLKTHDASFSVRPQFALAKVTSYGCKDIVLAPYGEYWRELRKICTLELLTTKRVKSLWSIREEEAEASHGDGRSMILEEDLLDGLLRVRDQGGLQIHLEDDNIKAVILDMIGAGSDTSATVLEWVMSELMRNPEVMKKVQAEVREVCRGKPKISEDDLCNLKYMKMVIKETLRLHPPAPLILRECTKTCNILGYDILQNSRVIFNAYEMGRDPQYWYEAEEFKPERFEESNIDFKGNNYEFIPFGAGRRMCAGMTFGIATIETALAHLLYYFNWKLPSGVEADSLDMSEKMGATVRRKFNMCLFAEPCIPCPVP